ncbi:response regulator transcription factor [Thermohalobacter berrensis]|uniref:DNA-binding response regulator n=1 Tax=Thermohalobacter berrensis TaxID=99594 RepID=A0A419T258_9FIRM|nr:response regulator transcription factor [Thermohalobacter berrensis]RKD31577.1 DNA-binding response regulator [Thermohalobacter berrensis]
MKLNILVVDDERLLVKGLKSSLERENFNVYVAYDGKKALEVINKEKIDFIILDLMLPEIDGITLCKKIRQKLDIPIIMLTAKDDYVDKILGLEMGADDYITKPFHTRELIARIRAVYRRFNKTKEPDEIIEINGLKFNTLERTLYKGNKEIILTAKEFDLLKILITNRGRVFKREELYELVWDELGYDTRTVDVHIRKLREKIEDDPSNPKYIKTKWGVGYFFRKERV